MIPSLCLLAYLPSSASYHTALRFYYKLITIPILRSLEIAFLDYGAVLVATVSARFGR